MLDGDMRSIRSAIRCIFVTFCLIITGARAAEMVQLSVKSGAEPNFNEIFSEPLDLRPGDSAEVVGVYANSYANICLSVTVLGKSFKPNLENPYTIAGPARLMATSLNNNNGANGNLTVITVKVTRFDEAPETAGHGTAVVIPEQAQGIFQVVLESSTDMVTWTAANPGSYGGDTAKRFFRVRCVKQ